MNLHPNVITRTWSVIIDMAASLLLCYFTSLLFESAVRLQCDGRSSYFNTVGDSVMMFLFAY